jgi:hypothetical protein
MGHLSSKKFVDQWGDQNPHHPSFLHHLIGCSYNFCVPHHELSKTKQFGVPWTPAMAAGLTDHVWSICELLRYRVAPLRLSLNQRDADDQSNQLSRSTLLATILSFAYERGFYARPPVSDIVGELLEAM